LHFDGGMTPLSAIRSRAGFTLIEVLIVIALIGILAAITAPFVIAAKAAANESSAIGTLRTLNTAQYAYQASCGSGFYAPTFTHLVAEGFAGPDLDLTPKSGFAHALAPGAAARPGATDCTGNASQGDYYASSVPLGATSGRRGFATNQIATLWQDTSGVAPLEPFVEAGTVAPIRGE
jgi:prepilin-type N-terminal cleavage/methylation domain-containing protein